jgi:glycosyl transferase family 25
MKAPRTHLAASLFLLNFLLHTSSVQSSFEIPISIINLDKDIDRWSTVISQLESKGVPMDCVEKLRAVNGKELTKEQLAVSATAIARSFATPGMIGCYLSHRNFWEKTACGSAPYRLVLEDDVVLADDFCNKLQEAIAELEECSETKDNWYVMVYGIWYME